MKRANKILALVLSYALIASTIFVSLPVAVNAAPVTPTQTVLKDGESKIVKTAEPVKGEVNKWKVRVRAEYNPVRKPTDVLVLLDRSGSMADGEREADGTVRENVDADEQRMANAKKGINELTKRVLAQNKENKVALYSYSYGYANNQFYESLTKHTNFTDNPATIQDGLTSITPYGGTFTQMALHKADEAMSKLKQQDTDGKRNRVVVLVTDGKPTVGYKVDMNKLSQEQGGIGSFFDWKTDISTSSDYPYYKNKIQDASNGQIAQQTDMVQNGKYYSVGYGVRPLGSAYAPKNAFVSNGKIPASSFIYSDGNPKTQEGRSNILNRIGWGCDVKYAVFGIDNQGRHMYWDIPENTVIEANAVKAAGNINDLYVVGLVTDNETNGYLERMASPNKFYPSSSKNFRNTIDSILKQIEGEETIDESLKDIIGDEFSEPTEIKTTKGEAKYIKSADGTDNGHIDWNIGKPTNIKDDNVPEADKVYYEELSYVLTMKDGWEKTENKTFKTNGKTEVTVVEKFKEEEINKTTAEAISPEVDPIKLTIEKDLKGVDGANPAFPDETFNIELTGPDGSNYVKKASVKNGESLVIGDLKSAGTYKITETGNYDKVFKITAIDPATKKEKTIKTTSFTLREDGSVKISGGENLATYLENDIKIVITNTEKKVKIGDYVWNDANNDGVQDATENPIKDVTVKLLDKDGRSVKDKDGKEIKTTTDASGKYLFEVAPGEYKVEIVVPSGYGMSNNQAKTTDNFVIKSGEKDLTKDFGLVKPKTYNVKHKFESEDPNVELPEAVKKLLPSDQKGKADGSKVTPTEPAKTTVETNEGTWTFTGYDKGEKTVDGKDVEFIGKWKFTPKTYKVTHEFKVAKDSSIKEFPAEVKTEVAKQLPDEQTGKKNGEVVKPGALKNATNVEDKANDGSWKFKAFIDQDPATEKVDAKINNADVNFVGEWTFVPNKHNVTYEYKSGTKGMDLPDALKKKAPSPVPDKVKGDKVTSPVPEGKDATFRDEANKGTWKFKSYDKKDVTIVDKDEHVVGTWVFEKDPEPKTYNVKHKFESEDPNVELPEAVKKLLPSDQKGKADGSKVNPTEPNTKKVDTTEGTWTFTGYDKGEKTVEGKDVEFIGKWKFTPKTYNVTHEFKVAKDSSIKEFPAGIKAEVEKQLPETQTGKKNRAVVEPGALKNPGEVEDKANDGKWKFTKFIDQDPATEKVDAKIDNADVNFVGEWTFVPNKHNVTYEYKSGTQGMDIPDALKGKAPKPVTGKVKGDKVTSPVPTGAEATFRDEANKGTWKFKSYDKKDVTIVDKDEHVVGTWVFEKDPAPKTYKVTHKFESEDPNVELPEAVKKLLPSDQKGKADGSKVTPTEPNTKKVDTTEGTWTFTGYDKGEKTVEGKDVEFIGKWKFTPKTYNVTHEFKVAKDSSIKEFPAGVKAEVEKQLPEEQTGKKNGAVVEPGALKNPAEVEDKANDGKWKFTKFIDQDPATEKVDAKINNSDVNFVGEWTFVPNKHNVTYEYKSGTTGIELPDALKKKAPSPVTGKVKGDKVTSPVPTGAEATFRDEKNKGTWKFKSYDKSDVTIVDKDEHVVGTWVFEKDSKPAVDGKDNPSSKDKPTTGDKGLELLFMSIVLMMSAGATVSLKKKEIKSR